VFFVSEDGRFRYVFGCGACTPGPIQIWQDRQGALVDVTRHVPRLIRRDAAIWLRLFRREATTPYGADGVLAAWVADEELLHRGGAAWAYVHREGRAGLLTKTGSGFSKPTAYYSQLHRFLKRLGYL
jgi:hypothetical protein